MDLETSDEWENEWNEAGAAEVMQTERQNRGWVS